MVLMPITLFMDYTSRLEARLDLLAEPYLQVLSNPNTTKGFNPIITRMDKQSFFWMVLSWQTCT